MKKVQIYTDGACSGNPGPGGWGCILIFGPTTKEASGFSEHTTNNAMELTAAIRALAMLKESCIVDLYTDSTYVKNGISKWIDGWKKNNWQNSQRETVKNADLWKQLDAESSKHVVSWHWVKGHADNHYNNIADRLATEAIKSGIKK